MVLLAIEGNTPPPHMYMYLHIHVHVRMYHMYMMYVSHVDEYEDLGLLTVVPENTQLMALSNCSGSRSSTTTTVPLCRQGIIILYTILFYMIVRHRSGRVYTYIIIRV